MKSFNLAFMTSSTFQLTVQETGRHRSISHNEGEEFDWHKTILFVHSKRLLFGMEYAALVKSHEETCCTGNIDANGGNKYRRMENLYRMAKGHRILN